MSPGREWKTEQEIKSIVHAEISAHPRIVALDKRLCDTEDGLKGLRGSLDSKHAENRESIHDLKDDQQTVIDLLHTFKADTTAAIVESDKKTTASIVESDKKTTHQFNEIKLTLNGAKYYVAGIVGMSGVLLAAVYKILDHYWK